MDGEKAEIAVSGRNRKVCVRGNEVKLQGKRVVARERVSGNRWGGANC